MSTTPSDYQRGYDDGMKATADALIGFVAIWAGKYSEDHGLDGLHPVHYDLLKKYGGRMDDFKRATVEGYS
jgi:hypothetical protein